MFRTGVLKQQGLNIERDRCWENWNPEDWGSEEEILVDATMMLMPKLNENTLGQLPLTRR